MQWQQILLAAASVLLASALPQDTFFPDSDSSSSVKKTDIRLGLVGGQLGGLCPVPGVSGCPGNTHTGNLQNPPSGGRGRSECWCQTNRFPCILNLANGESSGGFDLRILNKPSGGGQGLCNNGERFCCDTVGTSPIQPPRPPPVIPNPRPISTQSCGTRQFNGAKPQGAGHAVANFAEYPWLAAILDGGNRYKGAGTLVSDRWVLTAAHKVEKFRSNYISIGLKTRMGDYDVSGYNQALEAFKHEERDVVRIVVHHNFDGSNLHNDVAMLELNRPIGTNYPHISTVCLPSYKQLYDGQNCWVAGWGKDDFIMGSYQAVLLEVDVPIVDHFRCQNMLQNTQKLRHLRLSQESFICAGGQQGKDSCEGDGGAPLVCRNHHNSWTVVGLVAWGSGCGQQNLPGVYVNVPSYVKWIESILYGSGGGGGGSGQIGDVRSEG